MLICDYLPQYKTICISHGVYPVRWPIASPVVKREYISHGVYQKLRHLPEFLYALSNNTYGQAVAVPSAELDVPTLPVLSAQKYVVAVGLVSWWEIAYAVEDALQTGSYAALAARMSVIIWAMFGLLADANIPLVQLFVEAP